MYLAKVSKYKQNEIYILNKLRNNNFKEVFPEWSRIIKDDAM